MKIKIYFYATPGGGSPVQKYIEALDEPEAAPIYAALGHLARYGLNRSIIPYRVIDGKLWELKLGRHRIFYVIMTGASLVLLHACKKQGRKTRKADMELSQARMQEVLGGARRRPRGKASDGEQEA